MTDIPFASLRTIADALRAGRWSAEQVVAAHLQRIAAINPALNAVMQLQEEAALAEARAADRDIARGVVRGPLHGVPMTIKDSLDTAGVISTGGTLGRAATRPAQDAAVVARLRAAGAILLGKTNTPELTLAFETDNLVYGRTNNPYALDRTCGGSSGGAAAVIAAGGSPFDIGSDTGGSVRLPAHFCGIAGLRPTSGRVPRSGHILPAAGYLEPLTVLGPMARFVNDLALLLPIIAGPDGHDAATIPLPLRDPRAVELAALRAAVFSDNGIMPPTPETAAVVAACADALASARLRVESARPAAIAQTSALFSGLMRADGGATTRRLLERYGTRTPHPWLQSPAPDSPPTAAAMAELLEQWGEYRSAMLRFLASYDVIICPACAVPAMAHGSSDDADLVASFSYTKSFSLTGWPAAVVRCGTSHDGLPIGVQVVAHPWREDVALAVARHLEECFGGWQRPPL